MLGKIRFRYVYMVIFSILTLALLFLTDPDAGIIQGLGVGAGFVATLALLTKIVLYITAQHVSRKGLYDYVDLQLFFEKALQEPTSAAIALVAMSIFVLSITLIITRFA